MQRIALLHSHLNQTNKTSDLTPVLPDFKNKTVLITGATRGIGRAIALQFAKTGANIVILAKTDTPHPKLPGTIHSVALEC